MSILFRLCPCNYRRSISFQTYQRNGRHWFRKIIGEQTFCAEVRLSQLKPHQLPLQFNKLLTGDERIIIGNDIESETNDVQDYIMYDRDTGHKVKIVDTPGFDNSRNGVTDTDILRKISEFLVNKWVFFH